MSGLTSFLCLSVCKEINLNKNFETKLEKACCEKNDYSDTQAFFIIFEYGINDIAEKY